MTQLRIVYEDVLYGPIDEVGSWFVLDDDDDDEWIIGSVVADFRPGPTPDERALAAARDIVPGATSVHRASPLRGYYIQCDGTGRMEAP